MTVTRAGRPPSVEPGAPAIIPGKAEMVLQFRDADPAVLIAFETLLHEIVAAHDMAGPCKVECVNLSRTMPAPMEERLLEAMDEAAARHAPGKHMRMPSGAGHDAQIMTRLCPSAMMFVRCRGGISHNPAEFASEADMGLAVAALIHFIERFKP